MAKIREFMTGWPPGTMTSMMAWSEREKDGLRGSASGKRKPPKLRVFDLIRAPHQPVPLLANPDMRCAVESTAGPAPHFSRNINFDHAIFQFAGTTRVETEMGTSELTPGEMLHIPRGIAYRTIGDAAALCMTVDMRAPVTTLMGEDQCTSRTRYDVRRLGGPDFSAAAAATPATGDILEKMYVWHEDPADAVEVRRRVPELLDVTSTKRDEKISAITKLRPFDLFTDITGRKGPGPKIMGTEHSMFEVYNTVGEQFAFHRALESEEFGLQFGGTAENMSEFEALMPMAPGDWFLIPLGIAHSVKECKPDFRRIVIYSRYPFTVLADAGMHAHESSFEVTETVLEPAAWHAELHEPAAPHP